MKLSKFSKKVLAELVKSAKKKEMVTYGDLAARVGNPGGQRCLRYPLGYVSEYTYGKLGVMLSVIVVNDKTRLPGPGFNNLASQLMGLSTKIDDDYAVNHIKNIHALSGKELNKLLTVATLK